ncbi:non-hydrolyzing UDP-N-acetylglucosamine 2-epimerase [Bauldia litoralis]|uniref:non-hydrolyzing UDP-N-acetylglucosamine 2-epimerase n=3 Tax=Bauldia litoralis TaxID=665467 RepID=UPI0032668000
MPRILVVFGTRPEAIKLWPVIVELERQPDTEVSVCVTAQHRSMLDQVLETAGLTPDYDLDLMRDAQSLDALTARILTGLGPVLDEVKPDCVVVQGDTATAMSASLAAYYKKVPVAHIEAGLRSGNIYEPWPEEVARRVIGTIARYHFAPTRRAADALRAEGVPGNVVFQTGNTVIDALLMTKAKLDRDRSRVAGLAPLSERFSGKRILLVTCHRRESFGAGIDEIMDALLELAERGDVGIIFPIHPNPAVRGPVQARLAKHPAIALIEPQDYPHFVRLLDIAHLVLTDSGGIQEEAPALGKPVLVLRNTTERGEGVDAGTARLVGTDRTRIVSETNRLLDDAEAYAAMAEAHSPFGDGHAASRIAAILARMSDTAPSPVQVVGNTDAHRARADAYRVFRERRAVARAVGGHR